MNAMTAVAENPRAVIGGNNPPITPYEAHKDHIDDLEMEAKSFLDGEPIATEAQAEAVSKLLDDARKAHAAAEEQRKVEAKPFDDGKKAVQELWTPITREKTGRCALIAENCKQVLAPWLTKLADEQRAAAEAARLEAQEKAAAARKVLEAADIGNLSDRIAAEAAIKDASRADRVARSAEKARPQAKGGERAVGLRRYWRGEITDMLAFGKWAWEHRRPDYEEFLTALAVTEARSGPRPIPGLNIIEDKRI